MGVYRRGQDPSDYTAVVVKMGQPPDSEITTTNLRAVTSIDKQGLLVGGKNEK